MSAILAHQPQQWSPMEVLEIINPEAYAWTCVAQAPSTGRRCRRPLSQARKNAAIQILDTLPAVATFPPALKVQLLVLAHMTICTRQHQNQAEAIAARWYDDIMAVITPDPVDGDLSSGHSSDDDESSDLIHGDLEDTNEDPVSESPDVAEESAQRMTPSVSSHETFGRSRFQSIAQISEVLSLQSVHDTTSTSPATEPLEDTNVENVLAAAASLVTNQFTLDQFSDGILTPGATDRTDEAQGDDQVQVLGGTSSSTSVDSAVAQPDGWQTDNLESGHNSSDVNEATPDEDNVPARVDDPDHVDLREGRYRREHLWLARIRRNRQRYEEDWEFYRSNWMSELPAPHMGLNDEHILSRLSWPVFGGDWHNVTTQNVEDFLLWAPDFVSEEVDTYKSMLEVERDRWDKDELIAKYPALDASEEALTLIDLVGRVIAEELGSVRATVVSEQ